MPHPVLVQQLKIAAGAGSEPLGRAHIKAQSRGRPPHRAVAGSETRSVAT